MSTSVLASFFAAYKDIGRQRAIELLHRKAYRHPTRRLHTVAQWALAEMLYHGAQESKLGVFQVFARHFSIIGVPVHVAKLMNEFLQRSREDVDDDQGEKAADPVVKHDPVVRHDPVVKHPEAPPQRMFPSSHHTALIWRVTASSTRSSRALERLYQELLDQVNLARNPEGITSTGEAVPNPIWRVFDEDPARHHAYVQPVPSPILFDDAHFNCIIDAFNSRKMFSRSLDVFMDMFKLHIQPSNETFKVVANALASSGELKKLDALLTRMEEAPDVVPDAALDGPQFLRPTEETYTVVILALLHRNDTSSALEIAKRLYLRNGYVSGTNPFTDSVLRRLLDIVENSAGTERYPRNPRPLRHKMV